MNVLDVMEHQIKVTPHLLENNEQAFEDLDAISVMRRPMLNSSMSLPGHPLSEERA